MPFWILAAAILIAPLVAQIYGAMWFLRRIGPNSDGRPLNWLECQVWVLIFNIGCTAIEGAIVYLLAWTTSGTRYSLGYLGMALFALVTAYAAVSFVAGVIFATSFWWVERDGQAGESES